MNKKTFSAFAFVFTVLFTYQAFDLPPLHSHARTCCGRSICLCKHAPGALCPLRKTQPHSHCALHKEPVSSKAPGLTKAPCATDTPKTLLPQYAKEFLIPEPQALFAFTRSNTFPRPSRDALPLLFARSLERPPRIF